MIYVGDDVTDEDAMRDLKGLGFSFKISSSTLSMTNADRILPGTDSVVKLLEWVEDTVVKRSGVDTEIGINILLYSIQTLMFQMYTAYLNFITVSVCNSICF